jgi:Tfp pilus assembly protein PilV
MGAPENTSMLQRHLTLLKHLLNCPNTPSGGFVLLEVLVAIGLISGVWMALVGTYQNLALRNAQEESKRAQIRKEFDAFEIGEQLRANNVSRSKDLNHESSRVSGRHRAVHATSKPNVKKQR